MCKELNITSRLHPSAPPLEYMDNILLCATAPIMTTTLPMGNIQQKNNYEKWYIEHTLTVQMNNNNIKRKSSIRDVFDIRKLKKLVRKITGYKRKVKWMSSSGCFVVCVVVFGMSSLEILL